MRTALARAAVRTVWVLTQVFGPRVAVELAASFQSEGMPAVVPTGPQLSPVLLAARGDGFGPLGEPSAREPHEHMHFGVGAVHMNAMFPAAVGHEDLDRHGVTAADPCAASTYTVIWR